MMRHIPLALLVTALLALPASPVMADTFEPNDTPQQASELPSGVAVESFISSLSDLDFFFIDVDAGPVIITLTGIPFGTDYDLAVTDINGDLACDVCLSDNSDNENEILNLVSDGPGRFYVLVGSFIGFNEFDSYVLTATYTPLNQNTPPSVTLTAPNGGESWPVGSVRNITWTASDTEDGSTLAVDLELSTNGGGSWSPLASGLTNTGSFAWTVAGPLGSQTRVRATVTDSGDLSTQDASDANFTLTTAAQITLSIPTDFDASAGQTVDVPVTLSSNVALGGIQFGLAFDGQQADIVSVTDAGLLGGLSLENNTAIDGELRVIYFNSAGGSANAASGTLCTVRFQMSGILTGDANLTFIDAEASDPDGNALSVATTGAVLTPVRLLSLDAQDTGDGARISWQAVTDGAHAGYRVLRDDVGALHAGLLAATASEYLDRTAAPGASYRYWLEAVARDGSVQRFGPVETTIGSGIRASQPYPNPTRAGAALKLSGVEGAVSATVVDIRGRVIRHLETRGLGEIQWDGRTEAGAVAPGGIYFFRIQGSSGALTRRVVKIGD